MRPLDETTPHDRIAESHYAVRQLQRRPSLSGEFRSSWCYLIRTVDRVYTSGANVTPFTASTTTATSDSTVMTGDTTNGWVTILKTGVYVASFSGDWTVAFSGDKWAHIDWGVNNLVAPDQSWEVIEQSHGSFKVIDFVIVDSIVGGGADTITPLLQQTSGVDRTMNEASFRVVRIAPYL